MPLGPTAKKAPRRVTATFGRKLINTNIETASNTTNASRPAIFQISPKQWELGSTFKTSTQIIRCIKGQYDIVVEQSTRLQKVRMLDLS